VELDYDAFANALREIDEREDVLITVWQGKYVASTMSPLDFDPTFAAILSYWKMVLRVRYRRFGILLDRITANDDVQVERMSGAPVLRKPWNQWVVCAKP
jgi:hypothetical protein